MSQRLEGKVALITGGGSGIGAATARRFAASGAKVVVTGRRQGMIDEVAREIGGLAIAGDACDGAHSQTLVDAAVAEYGGLDILVACAGVETFGSATDVDLAQWSEVMRTNIDGVLLSARASIPAMRQRGGGAIVVIGSVASLFSPPQFTAYVTSKHALVGLTRSLAVDYSPEGIRVNCVCPGWTRTEMGDRTLETLGAMHGLDLEESVKWGSRNYPLRRAADPSEIASAIEFLASSDASYITGVVLPVDGGASVVDLGMVEFTTGT
jgi:meso-butanediol dehydrogenase/(S,S)-butanediol dehydrogenase/diacetyl reductase